MADINRDSNNAQITEGLTPPPAAGDLLAGLGMQILVKLLNSQAY